MDHYWGKYRGLVTDVQDPDTLGRIRASVPEVLAGVESGWALPCVPYAGDGIGLHLIPPPGSGVWIEFEGGDPSRPVWTGCWWGAGELTSDDTPDVKFLRTPNHRVVLDDTAGSEAVRITDQQGSTLTLDADGVKLAHHGGANLSITDTEIRIENNGPALVLAGNSITLENQGQKIVLSAASVAINGSALEVK